MRHHHAQRTLGRSRNERTALLRGLAVSLITHGKIETTEAKAKELRPFIERLVTIARTNSVAARRMVAARLINNTDATETLFGAIAPKFTERPGGYTRITKTRVRPGDAAPMAIIEFVG